MCFWFYYTWLDISLFLVFLAHRTQRVMQAFTIIWRSLPSVVLGFKKKIHIFHKIPICIFLAKISKTHYIFCKTCNTCYTSHENVTTVQISARSEHPFITKVYTCNTYILKENSWKLCMLAYYLIENHISLQHFDWAIFEGVIVFISIKLRADWRRMTTLFIKNVDTSLSWKSLYLYSEIFV
jgi:hypothetical protein